MSLHFSCKPILYIIMVMVMLCLLFFLSFSFIVLTQILRTIYHFDPSNLPPCTKLQIPNASSPANTPSPTLSVNENSGAVPLSRKKNHNKTPVSVADETVVVVQRTSEKCDRENVSNAIAIRDENGGGACKPEIEISSELEVTLPEPTKNISMNSLLSPLNQTYNQQETQDNNLDRKADGECEDGFLFEKYSHCNCILLCIPLPVEIITKFVYKYLKYVSYSDNCQEAVVHLNVKSQSTSPNIPCDSEAFQLNPSDQSTPTNIDVNINTFFLSKFPLKKKTNNSHLLYSYRRI